VAATPDRAAPGVPRRPIVVALAAALAVTLAVIVIVALTRPASAHIEKGKPAPAIAGTTLDGEPFRLQDLRGHPVVINFWGPNCVPCRSEFPLLKEKLEEHAGDGLVVVGVRMGDTASEAQDFITQYGATWATVDDPDGAIKNAYRVVARPQSYFIDRDGILRSIQIGEVRDADFERQFDLIKGTS